MNPDVPKLYAYKTFFFSVPESINVTVVLKNDLHFNYFVFANNGIDEEAFNLLSEVAIRELIPNLGLSYIFNGIKLFTGTSKTSMP